MVRVTVNTIISEKAATLQARLNKATEQRDIATLKRLHVALTKHRPISNYAGWTQQDAFEAALATVEALKKCGVKEKTPRKPRVRGPRPALDLSTLAQSDLFEDLNRWPRRPYCSDDLENGVRIRGLGQALLKPYISANPPFLRVWSIFDIDRPGAANAWDDAGLPPPAWTSINKENGHAHSAWGLSAPVLVNGLGARDAPMRYLCAVESMMREKLQADTGFAGLITKNPSHPLWLTLRGPRMCYDLAELAEYLPGLEKHRPNKNADKVGLGRNVSLFDALRKWSYKAIRPFWGSGGLTGWNAWMSACNSQALVMNADMFGVNNLDGKEVWHLARSVARWTWKKLSDQGFREWQSMAGKKGAIQSAKVRAAASEDQRVSARLMRLKGVPFRAIADELGVSVGTVHNWCA